MNIGTCLKYGTDYSQENLTVKICREHAQVKDLWMDYRAHYEHVMKVIDNEIEEEMVEREADRKKVWCTDGIPRHQFVMLIDFIRRQMI